MKFSLIIVSYNPNLNWLEKALDSAKGLFDEYILVDDGSDIPIEGATVRHDKNLGIQQARNNGVALTTGDIICALDDDDIFIRKEVLKMKKFVKDNPADIWTFPCKEFGDRDGVWGGFPVMENIIEDNQIVGTSWYKKEVWEKLGGYDNCQAEDWSFWVRAYKKGFKFKHSNIPLYYHRIRINSLSTKLTGENYLKIQKEIKQIYENTSRLT